MMILNQFCFWLQVMNNSHSALKRTERNINIIYKILVIFSLHEIFPGSRYSWGCSYGLTKVKSTMNHWNLLKSIILSCNILVIFTSIRFRHCDPVIMIESLLCLYENCSGVVPAEYRPSSSFIAPAARYGPISLLDLTLERSHACLESRH